MKNIETDSYSFKISLIYTPPYDWNFVLEFLSKRLLKGVEYINDDSYYRSIELNGYEGWIKINHHATEYSLVAEISNSLSPVLPDITIKLNRLFDLNSNSDIIEDHLVKDPILTEVISQNPGLRIPGTFNVFELSMRTILEQQISVKAATTIAGRLINTFGRKMLNEPPYNEISYLCPTPECIAKLDISDLSDLGISKAKAKAIIILAEMVVSGYLKLESDLDPEETIKQLMTIPGVGPWTAHYIAMRCLRWPDAFPKEDIILRNVLGKVTAKQAEIISQNWSPWRSYATLYLWHKYNIEKTT